MGTYLSTSELLHIQKKFIANHLLLSSQNLKKTLTLTPNVAKEGQLS